MTNPPISGTEEVRQFIGALAGLEARLATAERVVEAADEVATRLLVLKKVGKLTLDAGLDAEHDKLLETLAAYDAAKP